MPISALERLRQLKAQGTQTSTPSGKSALERLRELKGIQAQVQAPQAPITPPAYLQQPKPVAPIGSFGAVKQQENIFTQPLKQQDFNVPAPMRTPEALAIQKPLTSTEKKIGDVGRGIVDAVPDVAKSFLDTGTRFAVEKGIPGIGPVAKQLLPEKISSPADIAAKFAGKAGADPQKIQEAYDEMPEIAKKEISLKYSKDPKTFASQLINDALNVYSGGVSSAFKGVSRPILRKLLTAAGVTLEGGAMSSAATFGQVLQEGGTVKEAASQGAEAFGPGAVVGGILSIPATVRTKAEKEADILAKVARKEEKIVAKQEKVINKAESLVDKASDVRSKRLNEFEESTGKPFSRVMVEQQLPIKKTKNGYFDGKEATQEALERVKQFESVKKDAYKTRPEAVFDVDEIANEVISRIDDKNSSLYEFNPETAQNMKDDILSYVDSYKKRSGTSKVNVEQLDELKKGAWQTGYDQLRPTKKKAARLFGNAAKDRIEETFANTEFGNIIKQINKNEGELLSLVDAIDVKGGRGIHGKVIRGGVLGKSFTQLLGGYAGTAIPVPVIGPLAGAYTSGRLVDFLLNPQRLTGKALKLLQKNDILPKYLKDINAAKTWLRSEQGKAYLKSILPTQKQLPAPKAGQAQFSEGAIPENPNAIITPYKQPTKIELPARKIGNQNSEMQPSIQKQALDQKALEDYQRGVIQDVKKEIPKEFPDPQMENNYNKFVNTLKNRKVAFKKEAIQSGDVESISNSLKNIMSQKEIEQMFYSQGMNRDDVLDMFRERLQKENPKILMGKQVSENLGYKKGIPPVSELFAAAPGSFEEYTDENGQKKYRINPERFVAGMALVAGIKNPKVQKVISKMKPQDFLAIQKDVVVGKLQEVLPKLHEMVSTGKVSMDELENFKDYISRYENNLLTDKEVSLLSEELKLKGFDPFVSDKRVFTTKKLPSIKN